MKKTLLLVLLITGFAFTSCNNDDDSVSPQEAIEGVWEARGYHFIRYRDGEKISETESLYDENNVLEMRFREDGSFVHYYRENGGEDEGSYTGTYTINKDEIILLYKEGESEDGLKRAQYSVSRRTLTMIVDEVNSQGGSVYREVTTTEYDKM
ncbi:lipocalin family protein [Sinomicrobium sp. M5D2P9]